MIDFVCPKCNWTGYPCAVLGDGRLVPSCGNPECGQADTSRTMQEFQQGITKDKQIVSIAPTAVQRAPVAGELVRPVVIPAYTTAPTDIIGSIRDRALYLESENARLDGVMAEADAKRAGNAVELKKLKKMLAAAERVDAPARAPFVPRLAQ